MTTLDSPTLSVAVFAVLANSACYEGPSGAQEGTSGGAVEASSQGPDTTPFDPASGPGSGAASTSGPTTATATATATATGDSTTAEATTGPTETSSTGSGAETLGTGPLPSEVDLVNYAVDSELMVLPSPVNNASGGTWNWDTNRVWIVENNAGRIHEYAVDDFDTVIRVITVGGINGADTEGLVYMGNGEVALSFESAYGVFIGDVPDGNSNVTMSTKQRLILAPSPPVSNNGLEGITYDPDNEIFYAVGEGQSDGAPRRFFRFPRPLQTNVDLTWRDAGLDVSEPFDADAVLPGTGGSLDLAGIVFDPRDGNVLIVSDTGSRVIQVDPEGDGTILSELVLEPNQWEGVTLVGPNADLLVVAESNEAQRFVYTAR